MCKVRAPLFAHRKSHSSQANGRSPECTRLFPTMAPAGRGGRARPGTEESPRANSTASLGALASFRRFFAGRAASTTRSTGSSPLRSFAFASSSDAWMKRRIQSFLALRSQANSVSSACRMPRADSSARALTAARTRRATAASRLWFEIERQTEADRADRGADMPPRSVSSFKSE